MVSYRVQLREVRLATDGTDDVALFDVAREEDGATWIIPAYLSPLFRLVHMSAPISADERREMVAGLGARALVGQLREGVDPGLVDGLLFAVDYPGAPDDPDPLASYDRLTVEVEEHKND